MNTKKNVFIAGIITILILGFGGLIVANQQFTDTANSPKDTSIGDTLVNDTSYEEEYYEEDYEEEYDDEYESYSDKYEEEYEHEEYEYEDEDECEDDD